jgi:hypothetical protein
MATDGNRCTAAFRLCNAPSRLAKDIQSFGVSGRFQPRAEFDVRKIKGTKPTTIQYIWRQQAPEWILLALDSGNFFGYVAGADIADFGLLPAH